MNQSATTSTTEESPSDFRLHRGRDGWSGGNTHFRVVDNMIKVKKSDADATILPTEQQRRKLYDEAGNFSQHVQQYKGDHIFQLWMSKIGPYLADWVLDKRDDPTSLILPWKLLAFPAGYTLWIHLTGDQSDPANPRTDAYLYGSQHKIFRSPMEFVEHAIWLMKGGSAGDQCLCKYCTPGQSQREINRRLNHGDDSDDDDDDNGNDGSPTATAAAAAAAATTNASRHRIFRNRPGGRGAGIRGERRIAKRQERPSIRAKDYRVGNNNFGGGGGSGSGSGSGTAV